MVFDPGNRVSNSGNIFDGLYHYVVGVNDGARSYLYVDGILKNSVVNAIGQNFSEREVRIGSYVSSYYFNGYLDDVRVYNRALSSSEISQIYNQTKSKYQ